MIWQRNYCFLLRFSILFQFLMEAIQCNMIKLISKLHSFILFLKYEVYFRRAKGCKLGGTKLKKAHIVSLFFCEFLNLCGASDNKLCFFGYFLYSCKSSTAYRRKRQAQCIVAQVKYTHKSFYSRRIAFKK